MKKYFYLILISLFFLNTYSQNNKINDLYIYVPNQNFTASFLGYKAYFFLESQEEDFNHDTYFFNINFPDLDHKDLFKIGNIVDKNSINYIKPISYFKNKAFCEMHLELSGYVRIFIVTDFPNAHKEAGKPYKNKLVLWHSNYSGSMKDITFTNMSGKNLIDN